MTQQPSAREAPIELALVVAAGRGSRMGDAHEGPKQYRDLNGQSVLARTLAAVAQRAELKAITTVIHRDDRLLYDTAIGMVPRRVPLAEPVIGGETRQQSVLHGLEELAKAWPRDSIVLIHDGVRPFVTPGMMANTVAAVRAAKDRPVAQGVVPARAVVDTLVAIEPTHGQVVADVPRSGIATVETPQVFVLGQILDAHRRAAAAGFQGTDDASLLRWAGGDVLVTAGSVDNFKITTADDLRRARAYDGTSRHLDVRTGHGFDVHTFGPGDHIWLGGVRIPHVHGVVAHSDGDVVLHALTDALLGTIADRDIGYHFRNTDPRWRGAASDKFLDDAVRRVAAAGGTITLLDVTVLAEAPKVGPHRDAMTATIAAVAGIDVRRVSIKATTTEGLGAFGRREGLAALATATVVFRS